MVEICSLVYGVMEIHLVYRTLIMVAVRAETPKYIIYVPML